MLERENSVARRCAIPHCAKLSCENVPCSEPDMCPQQLRFKSGGLCHLGAMQKQVYHGRKFDIVDQLKQAIVLEWFTLPRRFIITASYNGNVVCIVS